MRVKLTERKVMTARPHGSRRQFLFDTVCPGLVVQVMPQGYKSYMLRARYPGGRVPVRRLLGKVGAMSLHPRPQYPERR
jgi:hypothetical protein